MALKRKSAQGQLAAASAVLLAASASYTRYIRAMHFTNNTVAEHTWGAAFASTCTASGPGVFNERLPGTVAGAASRADKFYPAGKRLDNTAISGFADVAASVTWEIEYDESDVIDA